MTRLRSRLACAMRKAQVVRSATLIPGFSPPKHSSHSRPTGTPLPTQFREVRFYPIPPVCLLWRSQKPRQGARWPLPACRQNCRMSWVSAHPHLAARSASPAAAPQWAHFAGTAGDLPPPAYACGEGPGSDSFVSRQFLLKRVKEHVQSSDRTGGTASSLFDCPGRPPVSVSPINK